MKKIIAISLVVIALVAVGAFIGKSKYDSMLVATSQGLAVGDSFGKTVAQSNCVLGLKIKYAACTTTECELSANGYIAGCMEAAEKDDFCNNVPRIQNTEQALNWASKTCLKMASEWTGALSTYACTCAYVPNKQKVERSQK